MELLGQAEQEPEPRNALWPNAALVVATFPTRFPSFCDRCARLGLEQLEQPLEQPQEMFQENL
jgi:hypothetical protein